MTVAPAGSSSATIEAVVARTDDRPAKNRL
jgi:hypothetical protein